MVCSAQSASGSGCTADGGPGPAPQRERKRLSLASTWQASPRVRASTSSLSPLITMRLLSVTKAGNCVKLVATRTQGEPDGVAKSHGRLGSSFLAALPPVLWRVCAGTTPHTTPNGNCLLIAPSVWRCNWCGTGVKYNAFPNLKLTISRKAQPIEGTTARRTRIWFRVLRTGMAPTRGRMVSATAALCRVCTSTNTSPGNSLSPGSEASASRVWITSWSTDSAAPPDPMIRMSFALLASTFMSSVRSMGLPSRYRSSDGFMPSKWRCMRTHCLISTTGRSASTTICWARLRQHGHRRRNQPGSSAFLSSASSSQINGRVFSPQPNTRMCSLAVIRL
mmetsp:Transcript_102623/g.313846  ORF Transcript_102623/g.313846 Transcript_102623/m.313846 type:complete len:336 (-) Transcript_102623:602-1609(-)